MDDVVEEVFDVVGRGGGEEKRVNVKYILSSLCCVVLCCVVLFGFVSFVTSYRI